MIDPRLGLLVVGVLVGCKFIAGGEVQWTAWVGVAILLAAIHRQARINSRTTTTTKGKP